MAVDPRRRGYDEGRLEIDVGVLRERMSDVRDAQDIQAEQFAALSLKIDGWVALSTQRDVDMDHRLGNLERLVTSGRTGARWLLAKALPLVGAAVTAAAVSAPLARLVRALILP